MTARSEPTKANLATFSRDSNQEGYRYAEGHQSVSRYVRRPAPQLSSLTLFRMKKDSRPFVPMQFTVVSF